MDRKSEMLDDVLMLQGNINRLCVTWDNVELESMYEYAKKRIDAIYQINFERINDNPEDILTR